MTEVRVPDDVRKRVASGGRGGREWLDALPDVVARLESVWRITVGDVLGGGWSVVMAATTERGAPAVLKIAAPRQFEEQGSFDVEVRALLAADGRRYVRVIEHDDGAVLLERLGRAVRDLGLSAEQQLDVIGATLRTAWRPPIESDTFRRGDDQARDLARWVSDAPSALAELAAWCAQERARAVGARVDAGNGVVIHGDAWPANVMEARDGGYKLIDPDPMISEPAHDLAIPLRDLTTELRAAGPDRAATMRRWCERMAAFGADADAIWQWAFVERVSTGLFLTKLGEPHGDALLATAAEIAGS